MNTSGNSLDSRTSPSRAALRPASRMVLLTALAIMTGTAAASPLDLSLEELMQVEVNRRSHADQQPAAPADAVIDLTGNRSKATVKESVWPLIVLSERVGDVALEALGAGVPVLRGISVADAPGVLYVDVDSIAQDEQLAVVDALRDALNRKDFVAIETSEFDFPKLKRFVSVNFPAIDATKVNDVAVILRPQGKGIVAESIDPSELAMYLGVPFEKTTAGYYSSIDHEQPTAKATPAVPVRIQYLHQFAAKANETTPTISNYTLTMNATHVDVWKHRSNGNCVVAWRATDVTDYWDVYLDLRSQVAFRNTAIDNQQNVAMKGGRGFVSRAHAYDDQIYSELSRNQCQTVDVTGHSLGAAAASIHALQLAHHATWRDKLQYVVAWNSPNAVDDATRKAPADTLKSYAEVHVFCRHHDWLVNPLPTGLHRIGNANSSPNKGCTFNKTGTTNNPLDPTANHKLVLWRDDF